MAAAAASPPSLLVPIPSAPPAPFSNKLTVVQLDGLALLKLLNHCKEHHPETVTGQLLGCENEGKLEITNSFPFPNSFESDQESNEYQMNMLTALRTVNIDYNVVGWYQAASFASFLTSDLISHQFDYQQNIPHSVVIIHDPLLTARGRLVLKAFRLNDEFMKVYEKSEHARAEVKVSQDAFNISGLDMTAILEELPIKVHNSHLVHAFLYELREEKSMTCEADRLSLSSSIFLERNLLDLASSVDDFLAEQNKLVGYQRSLARQRAAQQAYLAKRAAENEERVRQQKEPLPEEDLSKNALFKPLKPPTRLAAFMTANQIQWYAQSISAASAQALAKLYLTQALHKE